VLSRVSWYTCYLVCRDTRVISCVVIHVLSRVSWYTCYLVCHDTRVISCVMIHVLSRVSWYTCYLVCHDTRVISCVVIHVLSRVSWYTRIVLYSQLISTNSRLSLIHRVVLLSDRMPILQSVPFILKMATSALTHTKNASAAVFRDSCVQNNYKRNAL